MTRGISFGLAGSQRPTCPFICDGANLGPWPLGFKPQPVGVDVAPRRSSTMASLQHIPFGAAGRLSMPANIRRPPLNSFDSVVARAAAAIFQPDSAGLSAYLLRRGERASKPIYLMRCRNCGSASASVSALCRVSIVRRRRSAGAAAERGDSRPAGMGIALTAKRRTSGQQSLHFTPSTAKRAHRSAFDVGKIGRRRLITHHGAWPAIRRSGRAGATLRPCAQRHRHRVPLFELENS